MHLVHTPQCSAASAKIWESTLLLGFLSFVTYAHIELCIKLWGCGVLDPRVLTVVSSLWFAPRWLTPGQILAQTLPQVGER